MFAPGKNPKAKLAALLAAKKADAAKGGPPSNFRNPPPPTEGTGASLSPDAGPDRAPAINPQMLLMLIHHLQAMQAAQRGGPAAGGLMPSPGIR